MLLRFRQALVLISGFFLSGCVSGVDSAKPNIAPGNQTQISAVPVQIQAPKDFKSILLKPTSRDNGLPIITLNSGDQLELNFDVLSTQIENFSITFRHFEPGWVTSPMLSIDYMTNLNSDVIDHGKVSSFDTPAYVSYSYSFPNRNIGFKISGSYLLEVQDPYSGEVWFSLPFWVQENLGDSDTRFDHFPSPTALPRTRVQQFLTYKYPGEVSMPQVDLKLEVYFNRRWGKPLTEFVLDQSRAGQVIWHPVRANALPGVYEIENLDLRNIRNGNPEIFSYSFAQFPPSVRLLTDQPSINTNNEPAIFVSSIQEDVNRRYFNVEFRMDGMNLLKPGDQVFLYGSFNNWLIQPEMELLWNADENVFFREVLIREGIYGYKYLVKRDGKFLEHVLEDPFNRQMNEYVSMVYFKDIRNQYHRLIHVNISEIEAL